MSTPTTRSTTQHTDPSDTLLSTALARAEAPVLWIVDEHISHPSRWLRERKNDVTVISNRYDSYLDAQMAGIPAHFNDIELTPFPATYRTIVYRISKEKALVHHIINASKNALQNQGTLMLIGGKQEGIKTYIDKASAYLGPITHQQNGEHSTRLACLQKSATHTEAPPLDDKDYPRFRQIGEEAGLQFYSKPGQFGWDKIDQGSQFLVTHFDTCFDTPVNTVNASFNTKAPGHVLDLGCGYGYLALHISRYKPERIIATDNNAAALASCRFNFAHNHFDYTTGHDVNVIADDCGRRITEKFDTIICNPPFHQGFSTSTEMTDRFIEQTRRLLKPTGQALFVVNQFIPLEQKAADSFRKIEAFAKNKGFKLVRLQQPKR